MQRLARAAVVLAVLLCAALPASAAERLRLATTTSTENSGLLADLLPLFEQRFGCAVHVIAVGTGKALALGRNGDVDLVLVHARQAEDAFVAEGWGVNRRDVMYNDFVLVGPPDDPARIADASDAADALRRIATGGCRFVSRGDDSGTHKKERQLWQEAGVAPEGRWYLEVGQGMGTVLMIAAEKQAYTLSDRGTWLALADAAAQPILCAGDPRLFNPYGVIAVNPARHPEVHYVMAMALIGWLTSPEAQARIRIFGRERYGRALFVPTAVP